MKEQEDSAIKVLLFDVDGVLVNGRPFSEHLARDHGITVEATASFFRGRFLDCLVGKCDLKQELAEHLPVWGWRGSLDDFLDYWFRSEHAINEPLVAATQQFRHRGIRCYIATNQERYRTRYILDQMSFADMFDGMFSSVDVGHMKDDRAFFEHVVHQFGDVPADNILFWDDGVNNVMTARSVGLQAEVYRDFADFRCRMELYAPES